MSLNLKKSRNLTMMTDFYEITMANGYLASGYENMEAVFDLFFRKVPDNGGFAIFAGLEQVVEYLDNLSFSEEDLDYLRSFGIFSEEFLAYLKNFKFACDVWAMPEGTPIFPYEPIVTVRGPIMQAQFIETMLLTTINHQSLIATKANRVVRAAQGKPVMEFGARRAQGHDGAIYGSRAAFIGGCQGTSCVISSMEFDIPASGTMAHSWVQSFDDEYNAFLAYANVYPSQCVLLVDTYNVLKSGIPNAIKVFDEVLKPKGIRPQGIRIDSGDIAYLSKKARGLLDAAGYSDVPIIVSNSLDETIIQNLILQQASVDIFAVGENLITSQSSPVFGGVYKLAAVGSSGKLSPRIKKSETLEKVTLPDFKKVYRFFSKETGRNVADLIALHDEKIECENGITLFDPMAPWKKKHLTDVTVQELQIQIYQNGKRVYELPTLKQIQTNCLSLVDKLWDEVKRFEYPHRYYVDLSQKLWDLKNRLLDDCEPGKRG